MRKYLLLAGILLSVLDFTFAQTLPLPPLDCPSDQIQKKLLQDPVFLQQDQDIEAIYQDALRHNNATAEEILMIPVVVHVMHGIGQPIGNEENISMAQIETAIQQLNEAFANTGEFSGNGANIGAGDPRESVNVEVQFCLAVQDPNGDPTNGVNRVATNLTVFNMDENSDNACNGKVEGDLKDLSRWDTDQYFNIWIVREICSDNGCSVAGYAYFPSSHGQCWDGAVVEARTFGTSTDNTKVLIHEVGHYLNLYHTFEVNGECTNTDCSTDGDRVCDTPPALTSNYNPCATPGNSCTTDATSGPFVADMDDLIADYMAYSHQSCQNTFTNNQKTRMRAAIEPASAPRHQLLTSSGCTNTGAALAYFYEGGAVIAEALGTNGPEANDCRLYVDYPIDVRLYAPAAATLEATITATDNGATNGADYQLIDNTATFAAGETQKTIILRVYNDQSPESLYEGLTLTITTNNANFNNTMDIQILNNDNLPVPGRPVIYQTDFSSPGSWTMSSFGQNNSGNTWAIGANGGACTTGNSAYITNDGGATNNYTDASGTPIIYSPANATGYNGLRLEFDYVAGGNPDAGSIIFRPTSGDGDFYGTGSYKNVSCGAAQHVTYDFSSAYDGQVFDFGFAWSTQGNGTTQPGFTVDNILITAAPTAIATTTTSTGTAYLGPNATAVFYSATGELLAQINNLTNWDYGCTTIEIDNDGTGAKTLTGGTDQYTNRTIKITPTNNKEDGVYTIKLFYTEAEVSGWEAASNDTRANLSIIKSPTSMATATASNTQGFTTTIAAWDTDHSFSATINTGFSGFALGNVTPGALPIELTDFVARLHNSSVVLSWKTLSEKEFSHFVAEKSTDGFSFNSIARIDAKGSVQSITEYQAIDNKPANGLNYYRLKMVDLDGAVTYSNIVSIQFIRSGITNILPNPISDNNFTVAYSSANTSDIDLTITDILGRVIYEQTYSVQKGNNIIKVSTPNLTQAMYNLTLRNGAEVSVQRFWKK